jgi:hypothetical protein
VCAGAEIRTDILPRCIVAALHHPMNDLTHPYSPPPCSPPPEATTLSIEGDPEIVFFYLRNVYTVAELITILKFYF